MKEWSELEERYQEMKTKDPKAAEDFRKKMSAVSKISLLVFSLFASNIIKCTCSDIQQLFFHYCYINNDLLLQVHMSYQSNKEDFF